MKKISASPQGDPGFEAELKRVCLPVPTVRHRCPLCKQQTLEVLPRTLVTRGTEEGSEDVFVDGLGVCVSMRCCYAELSANLFELHGEMLHGNTVVWPKRPRFSRLQ